MASYSQPDSITASMPSGDVTYTLEELQEMPMGKFAQIKDYIYGGNRKFYRDALILAAGTDQAANGTVDLFRGGVGESGRVWNTQAEFRKTEFHTNMFEGGHFEYGVSVIVMAFEFLLINQPAKAAVVGTGDNIGQILDSADHATQPTGYNSAAFARALLLQNTFRFHRGAKATEEEGSLIDVPSSVGISASFGAGANNSLVQNSLGPVSIPLNKPKILHSHEPFFLRATAQSALKVPVDVCAWWRMDTIELREGVRG